MSVRCEPPACDPPAALKGASRWRLRCGDGRRDADHHRARASAPVERAGQAAHRGQAGRAGRPGMRRGRPADRGDLQPEPARQSSTASTPKPPCAMPRAASPITRSTAPPSCCPGTSARTRAAPQQPDKRQHAMPRSRPDAYDRPRCRRPGPDARTRMSGLRPPGVTAGAVGCSTPLSRLMQRSRGMPDLILFLHYRNDEPRTVRG